LDASTGVTGALNAARREAAALAGDSRVALVVPSDSSIRASDVPEFAKLVRLPIVPLRRSPGSILLYLPSLLYCGVRLTRAMRVDGCERLQVNDFYLMHGAVARLLGFRGRILTWVRFDPRRYGAMGRLWLWAARRSSDRLIAVSAFIQRLVGPGPHVRMVYDPVELGQEPQEPEPGPVRRLIFVGNYTEGKGQDMAIAAFTRIADRFPDAELLFFGGDLGLAKNRAYRQRLEAQAAAGGAADQIRFAGFQPDPAALLRRAYAALNCSRSESFSLTCQEASANGVPVIATRCGGPEEIVVDGATGFLVDLDDVDGLAERMTILLENPDRARDMGRAGRLWVESRFSPERYRNEIRGLFGFTGS
jgi:glycosyltransferase involved in cell wall biosynthesis